MRKFQQGDGVWWIWLIGVLSFSAWMTHVITCLSTGKWGFLVAGALFFPIGIIHGIGIWLGAWH